MEFTNPMFPGLFSDPWNAGQQVESLKRVTQFAAGDPNLEVWDYIVIGYDQEMSEFLAVIYSPRSLGRTLNKKNVNDVQEAYFCLLDNYIYDLEEEPLSLQRLEDDFGEDHAQYSSQPLSEIFDSWVARNQKMALEQNIKPTAASSKTSSKRKI